MTKQSNPVPKTILITGATDGLGLETAKALHSLGHTVLLHGRNPKKLERTQAMLGSGNVEAYVADLSVLSEVASLADAIAARDGKLDVLINNAGVFRTSSVEAEGGLDVRFVVNTLAPYMLTRRLLPAIEPSGRVVNLSSAAQASVDLGALAGRARLNDSEAYAQSKLALTMWSRAMGLAHKEAGPVIVSVNPKSMLGTKMVKEAYGVTGSDIAAGVDILRRAALEEEFAGSAGLYFDNDSGRFASPHPDALDEQRSRAVIDAIESLLPD